MNHQHIHRSSGRGQAVKPILAQGLTIEEAAQRIVMPKGTLANWVSPAKRGTDPNAPGELLRQRTDGELLGQLEERNDSSSGVCTRANAEAAFREYIEIFYQRQRRHSRLGYV